MVHSSWRLALARGAMVVLLAASASSAAARVEAGRVTWAGAELAQTGATPTPTPAAAAAANATTAEQAYLDWLQAYQQRQLAVVQTVPTTLDLANAGWRRDLALAVDSWGALIQQARDQRPPTTVQTLHQALLDAVESFDRARRLLLVAATTAQEPGPDLAAELQRGRDGIAQVTQQVSMLAQGRAPARRPSPTRGNLRVTVLGTARPYADRGAPADPGYEYFVVRLRLESVAGEPVLYDAYQFRLQSGDQTLHNPVLLGMPDELVYGALEGNRLAGEIVGNVAFPVRVGVPAAAIFYAPDPGAVPLEIPIGPPRSPATPASGPAVAPAAEPPAQGGG